MEVVWSHTLDPQYGENISQSMSVRGLEATDGLISVLALMGDGRREGSLPSNPATIARFITTFGPIGCSSPRP